MSDETEYFWNILRADFTIRTTSVANSLQKRRNQVKEEVHNFLRRHSNNKQTGGQRELLFWMNCAI